MRALSVAAILAGMISLVSAFAPTSASAPRATLVAPERRSSEGLSAVCPRRTIPDGEACVPLAEDEPDDELDAPVASGAHHDKRGRFSTYEQIPRKPERPEAYEAYVYPIDPPSKGVQVMSGYDLDRPDGDQRRGRALSHVGHGGIDLAQGRGAPVRATLLERQEGDAIVVHAGKLFGTTVVTLHRVREGGRLREYVVVHGHLDDIATGLAKGATVPEGALLGRVGDSGRAGVVHLHLETRRVRDGVDATTLAPDTLVSSEKTIVCDPRNVLRLRAPP